MSKEVLQAVNLKSVGTYALCGIAMGLVLALVPLSSLVSLIIIIVGLTMIAVNGYAVYKDFSNKKDTTNQTLLDVIGVLLGFILLVVRNQVVTILIAIYLFIEPVVKIVLSKGNKNVVMKQIPTIALGIILLFGGFSVVELVFKIIGVILILASVAYFAYNYYLYKKNKVKIIK
jgi:uncharacterized membrane protein HdeD (DUF308 family)